MTTNYKLNLGDNLTTLKTYPDNHFDSIVTDPPYGIDFLGKEWDSHTGTVELYKECLRVLKPGGYLLAFSAARTYHKLAYSVELAGFEIRDQLMWLYSSGFPKAQDIGKAIDKRAGKVEDTIRNGTNGMHGPRIEGFDLGSGTRCPTCKKDSNTRYSCDKGNDCGMVYKPATAEGAEWSGYKTALKPAHEPIVMARKPYKGSSIDQVLKNGLSALNIDATRVPWADAADAESIQNAFTNEKGIAAGLIATNGAPMFQGTEKKKKSDKEKLIEWESKYGGGGKGTFNNILAEAQDNIRSDERIGAGPDPDALSAGRYPSNVIGEVEEGYQKYFYCPKVSRKERHIGFDTDDIETNEQMAASVGGYIVDANMSFIPGVGLIYNHGLKHEVEKIRKTQGITIANIGNNHPTVKPVALMEYLIKMVTPPSTDKLQRKVLDPFMGSGSTGMAATKLGHHFTGCELDPKYVAIAETRITAWNDNGLPDELFGDEE